MNAISPHIRRFEGTDWPQVWPIFSNVVRAGDTFAYDPAMNEADARATWIERSPGLTVVALDGPQVKGTAKMGPNRPGPGSHIATASFMVAEHARGRGIGEALCRFALDWARDKGFEGMQFNAVAETNRSAIRLYERLGFTVMGTVPGAFEHPIEGRVGLHVMYRAF